MAFTNQYRHKVAEDFSLYSKPLHKMIFPNNIDSQFNLTFTLNGVPRPVKHANKSHSGSQTNCPELNENLSSKKFIVIEELVWLVSGISKKYGIYTNLCKMQLDNESNIRSKQIQNINDENKDGEYKGYGSISPDGSFSMKEYNTNCISTVTGKFELVNLQWISTGSWSQMENSDKGTFITKLISYSKK